jgi:hypothetical protein
MRYVWNGSGDDEGEVRWSPRARSYPGPQWPARRFPISQSAPGSGSPIAPKKRKRIDETSPGDV